MNEIPGFDTGLLNATQQARMEELVAAARRAVALGRPAEYRKTMEEAFRYYVTHHPELSGSPDELEGMTADFLRTLPRVKGRTRRQLTALKMLVLLVLGLGGAYTFLYLYFNRARLRLSEGMVFGGLVLLSLFLMALPLFFNRRKKE